jgi:hypothetical protein
MHVIILRYCPSFVEGDIIKGTHEMIETEINNRKYKYKNGYNIPFSSSVQLLDYRIKKECVADFLADLKVYNLNPKKNAVKLRHLLKLVKHPMNNKNRNNTYYGGKIFKVMFVVNILSKFGVWLEPFDVSDKKPELFFSHTWCYNFFLGVLPDIETEYGEEL